jgi:hypothetical protein
MSTTKTQNTYRIANIGADDAMILAHAANPDGSNFRKGHGGEDRNTSLPGFDSPTGAVQENGTYGGRRQSRRISYFARRLSCFCSKKRLEGDRACAMLSLSGWWLD